jgi:predicted permease
MDHLLHDLRLTFRSLRRQPGFTAVVVLTLALGIGVNTAVFTVARAMLLSPLPHVEIEGLNALAMRHATQMVEAYDFSFPDVEDFTAQCSVCESVAAYDRRSVVLADDEGSQLIQGEAVSPGLFALLGAEPFLGRTLQEGEDERGHERVAVVSHGLWQRLGGEPGIVGRDVRLDGRASTVVGVMPHEFHFPERADVWFPLVRGEVEERSNRWIDNVAVRLKPGVSAEQAQAEATTIGERLARSFPDSNKDWAFAVLPFRERLIDAGTRRVLALLAGAVGFVLLIACVNITNLLLARESGRQRTLAIRMALGSDRAQIVRQLMTENVVLALGGGALGILLASWTVDFIARADPEGFPTWMRFEIGPEALVFTLVLSLATAVAFGLLPALRAARPDLARTVGESHRGATGVREQQRLQKTLVTAQIALALTLLVGAGLVVRSVMALTRIDAGFDTGRLLTFYTQLAGERYDDGAARHAWFESAVERLASLPGVVAVAATSAVPLVEDGTAVPLGYSGQVLRDGERMLASYVVSTPGLFDVLDVPLLAGRRFTVAEAADPESRVAIVNQELVARVWGGRDPVGDRIRLGYGEGASWFTVVGVAPKIYYEEPGEETDQSRFQVHLPYAVAPRREMAFLVRTAQDAGAVQADVRRTLAQLDATLPVYALRTMDVVRREVIWGERLQGELLGSFAVLALVLSALGIYGVMAFVVAQRLPEIGVRMALGADRRTIGRLFLRQGLALVAAGVALGLLGTAAVTRLLEGLLYGVRPGDAATLAAAVLVLVGAAALGVFVPARRASRVEPVVALRHQ